MSVAEIRESKLFKAIADISVVHWLITGALASVSGIGAAVHGKPLESVMLYGIGVAATVLAALHYGGLLWTKHFSKGVPIHRAGTLKRLIIPALTAVVILAAWSIVQWRKPASPKSGTIGRPSFAGATITQATSAPQSAVGGLTPAQGTTGVAQQATGTSSPKKPNKPKAVRAPVVNASEKQPIPINSVVENAGITEIGEMSNVEAIAPPSGEAKILNTLPGGKTTVQKMDNARVSSGAVTATPPDSTMHKTINGTNDVHIGEVACGVSSLIKTEGSVYGLTVIDAKLNNRAACNWAYFLLNVRWHRRDISVFMKTTEDAMIPIWAITSNEFKEQQLAAFRELAKQLSAVATDDDKYNQLVDRMWYSDPIVDVQLKQP